MFSNNHATNNPNNADEDEEDEGDSYQGEYDHNDRKLIGSFVCNGPEINGNVHRVHVVMNHNPQEESMAINFPGLLSNIAFFVTLPWVLSVSLLISICLFQFV